MQIRMLTAAVALAFAAAVNAASFEFSRAGTLKIDNGAERSATLHLACSPDDEGGALSIELMVPEANTRKDFDYDDFEGPDAVAGGKPLSRIAWTSAAGTTEITYAAAGWYVPDPAGAFMFGVSQLTHRRQPPAKLIAAIGPVPGRLVWTQTGSDKARRELVATFELDAAASGKLHAAVVRCLPLNSPKNPGT